MHHFPDFDGGLLTPPNDPQILIGAKVDDKNVKTQIGFPFTYCNKTFDIVRWIRTDGFVLKGLFPGRRM